MADREGFEPSRRLVTVYALSRRAPSTARPPVRQEGREYSDKPPCRNPPRPSSRRRRTKAQGTPRTSIVARSHGTTTCRPAHARSAPCLPRSPAGRCVRGRTVTRPLGIKSSNPRRNFCLTWRHHFGDRWKARHRSHEHKSAPDLLLQRSESIARLVELVETLPRRHGFPLAPSAAAMRDGGRRCERFGPPCRCRAN
jgi:hypothetical protein